MNRAADICFWQAPRFLAGFLGLALLAGCATGEPEGLVAGASTTPGAVKTVFELGELATELPKPKDFVLQSRPTGGSSQFIPVHQRPPARPEPVLSADGVKQQQAALAAISKQHDAISGRPVIPPGAASKPGKPKKPKPDPVVPPT